ncbi:MAG: 30S ribosomal protein S13 [Candidatus Diapherotrites archaeon]|uniref:Small ribosomal subunit protein uS13 n=1 Tax=Candidatus Iainarchaeum sp. TaxID=3101447 RepID=A0A8T3YMA6_9ARCH|nr:30S ribosomal protein S13 [Candidatus Diapherotrites archaeon]
MEEKTKQAHDKHGKGHDRHQGMPHAHSKPVEDKDLRLIVRITGVDLDGTRPVEIALTMIKGIGVRMGKSIAVAFQKAHNIPLGTKVGKLTEEQGKQLEEVVMNPAKFGVPAWELNRRKDFFTGENSHMVMSELDLTLRSDLQRMLETKSYKGLRHAWGLPVRGQRTKSTHRGKGPVVGVVKKEVAKAAAPAKAGSAPAGKKEEKK